VGANRADLRAAALAATAALTIRYARHGGAVRTAPLRYGHSAPLGSAPHFGRDGRIAEGQGSRGTTRSALPYHAAA
jgi:hypothetical protein